MNYDDLSVHERIKHASEYAVILKNNPANTPGNIIAELAETFSLTKEQASEAYILSEEKFPEEHKKAARSKLRYYAAAIFIFFSIGLFYLGMWEQTGPMFFLILAALSLFAIWIVINLILKIISGIFFPNYPQLIKHFIVKTAPFLVIIWVFLLYQSKFGGTIKEEDIIVRPCMLAAKVMKSKSGGLFSEAYYEFSFDGYFKKFRFCQSDYIYADTLPHFEKYSPADTIYAELLEKDLRKIHTEAFFSKYNKIIGIQLNNKSIVNYNLRSEAFREKYRHWLNIMTVILLINLLLIYVLIKDIKNKNSVV